MIHMDTEVYLSSKKLTTLNTSSFGGGFPSHLGGNCHPLIIVLFVNPYQFFSHKDRKAVRRGVLWVKHRKVCVMICLVCNVELFPDFFSEFCGHNISARIMKLTNKL